MLIVSKVLINEKSIIRQYIGSTGNIIGLKKIKEGETSFDEFRILLGLGVHLVNGSPVSPGLQTQIGL